MILLSYNHMILRSCDCDPTILCRLFPSRCRTGRACALGPLQACLRPGCAPPPLKMVVTRCAPPPLKMVSLVVSPPTPLKMVVTRCAPPPPPQNGCHSGGRGVCAAAAEHAGLAHMLLLTWPMPLTCQVACWQQQQSTSGLISLELPSWMRLCSTCWVRGGGGGCMARLCCVLGEGGRSGAAWCVCAACCAVSSIVLFCAVCCVVLCCAVLSVVLFCAVLCYLLCCAVVCCARAVVWCGVVWCAVLCCARAVLVLWAAGALLLLSVAARSGVGVCTRPHSLTRPHAPPPHPELYFHLPYFRIVFAH